MAAPKPLLPLKTVPTVKTVPGFKAAPGRPKTNIGDYLIKPTHQGTTGYEMLNDTPTVQDMAKEHLKLGQLPPALQPKYLRKPAVMESGPTGRATSISRGQAIGARKPRSQQT